MLNPMAQPEPTRIAAFGVTDVGVVRAINQDAYAVGWIGRRGFLAAVADGMGGHRAGEIASRLALAQLRRSLSRQRGDAPPALTRAFAAAHQAVRVEAAGDATQEGMGTTLTALLIDDQIALIAHVGDSRAYRLRDGHLTALSEDHSWVAERVRQGILSETEARLHRLRNVITSALGASDRPRFDLRACDTRAGDRFLLCSDGLTMLLDDAHLQRLLADGTPQGAAQALIAAANALGAPDNVTAVVVDVETVQPQRKRYRVPAADAGPTRTQLGASEAIAAVEGAFPHDSRWATLRRAPWYPYRLWLVGSFSLVLTFLALVFGSRGTGG
jgi:PPM family protein phosphatase